MRFDLKAIARRKGRRRAVMMRPIEPTLALEADLARVVREVVAVASAGVKLLVLPAYSHALGQMRAADGMARDAAVDVVTEALRLLREGLNQAVAGMFGRLRGWFRRLEFWHREKFAAAIEAAIEENIRPYLGWEDVAEHIEALFAKAIAAIEALADQMHNRIERTALQGLTEQTAQSAIERDLSQGLGISREHVGALAGAILASSSGALDAARQQQAGIGQYVWITRRDDRVRPTHRARHGKVYRWDAAGIRPGQEYRCRCIAQPYLSAT